MLKQLANLTIDADGRYATDSELQFLKNYLDSADRRVKIYEKLRDRAETIIEEVKAERNALNEAKNDRLFYLGEEDRSATCIRDMTGILRCCAGAILSGDADRMREAVLLWYYTIVRAFGYENDTLIMYRVLEKIANKYLTEEEAKLAKPIFQLNHTILSP
jgi:Phycobilisome protein